MNPRHASLFGVGLLTGAALLSLVSGIGWAAVIYAALAVVWAILTRVVSDNYRRDE